MATIPITIAPDAAAHLAELGMQSQLDCMLKHTLQAVPGLRAIEVNLGLPYDTGDVPKMIIDAARTHPGEGHDRTDMDWATWKHDTFPPDVCEHFLLMSWYENAHAG